MNRGFAPVYDVLFVRFINIFDSGSINDIVYVLLIYLFFLLIKKKIIFTIWTYFCVLNEFVETI